MKVGDLVKIEGGKLRPAWYGEVGIITSLTVDAVYLNTNQTWYKIALLSGATRTIRHDMLEVASEGR